MKYRLRHCVWLLVFASQAFAQHWDVQYFYDEDQSTLSIEDLAFPTARRGIAVGAIVEDSGRSRFTALVTSDGGEHWTMSPLKERPRSLFFLDDSAGWMVTDQGIWFTDEAGRSWKKISSQKKPDRKLGRLPGGLIERVWFLDRERGFAAGLQKTALATTDGGHTWTPVEEAAKPAANPSFTSYDWIAFDGPKAGLIVGSANPRRFSEERRLPAWMEPREASRRYQVPTLTILLQTLDAGAHWTSSTAPIFGVVSNLHMAGPDGLAVVRFDESFEWPSEVYRIHVTGGKSERVFREKNRRVLSSALFPGPRAFLAAIEPPGRLNNSPVPGKVKILTSTDFTDWTEMDVDYKAVARSLFLSGPDADHLWCATDTGMILRLVR